MGARTSNRCKIANNASAIPGAAATTNLAPPKDSFRVDNYT